MNGRFVSLFVLLGYLFLSCGPLGGAEATQSPPAESPEAHVQRDEGGQHAQNGAAGGS